MNTIWHIFWTWAIFRRKKYAIKPLLFAIIPDVPWLFGVIFSILTNGINFEAFLQGYYYVPIIYMIFFFHSFLIVTLFFVVAKIKQKKKYSLPLSLYPGQSRQLGQPNEEVFIALLGINGPYAQVLIRVKGGLKFSLS